MKWRSYAKSVPRTCFLESNANLIQLAGDLDCRASLGHGKHMHKDVHSPALSDAFSHQELSVECSSRHDPCLDILVGGLPTHFLPVHPLRLLMEQEHSRRGLLQSCCSVLKYTGHQPYARRGCGRTAHVCCVAHPNAITQEVNDMRHFRLRRHVSGCYVKPLRAI